MSSEEIVNNPQEITAKVHEIVGEVIKDLDTPEVAASITAEASMRTEHPKVSFEFLGLPASKIEYGGNYSIAANPTPTKLVVTLVNIDRNANRIVIDSVESDGAVVNLSIPDFVRRKAKHYPQGDYEIVCTAYDADGNESKASVPVKLEAWDSSSGRRAKW